MSKRKTEAESDSTRKAARTNGSSATAGSRVESDSLGQLPVPAECLYGAQVRQCFPQRLIWVKQTARSLINFDIGHDRLPRAMIRSFGLVKLVR